MTKPSGAGHERILALLCARRYRGLGRAVVEVQPACIAVVLHGSWLPRARMAEHVAARLRQQFEVGLAPCRECFRCFMRPLRVAADILSQVLSEVRDDLSRRRSSSCRMASGQLGPVGEGIDI